MTGTLEPISDHVLIYIDVQNTGERLPDLLQQISQLLRLRGGAREAVQKPALMAQQRRSRRMMGNQHTML